MCHTPVRRYFHFHFPDIDYFIGLPPEENIRCVRLKQAQFGAGHFFKTKLPTLAWMAGLWTKSQFTGHTLSKKIEGNIEGWTVSTDTLAFMSIMASQITWCVLFNSLPSLTNRERWKLHIISPLLGNPLVIEGLLSHGARNEENVSMKCRHYCNVVASGPEYGWLTGS